MQWALGISSHGPQLCHTHCLAQWLFGTLTHDSPSVLNFYTHAPVPHGQHHKLLLPAKDASGLTGPQLHHALYPTVGKY